jgi:SET domain-containing protein
MNHSDNPNVDSSVNGNCYAVRDIQPGEELSEHYGTYEHPRWFCDLYAEYNIPIDYYEYHVMDGDGK